jgi:outer membrane immunogenic protein
MKIAFITSFLATAMLAGAIRAESFDGPYIGLQGGYERFNVDADFIGAGPLAGTNLSTEFHAAGMEGGLFLGYGRKLGNFYLGAEVDGSLGNADYHSSGGTTEIERRYGYGASLRAGWFALPHFLYYSRIGVVSTNFDYDLNVPSVPFAAGDDVSLTGLRLGLGAEALLTDHLTWRLGWDYTSYEDYTIRYSLSGTPIGSEKLSPQSHNFQLGLAYTF